MRALLVLLLAALLVLPGCGGSEKKTDEKPQDGACACGTAQAVKAGSSCKCADIASSKTGWCDHCGQGAVNGTTTACEACAKGGHLCDMCWANGNKPCETCRQTGKPQKD